MKTSIYELNYALEDKLLHNRLSEFDILMHNYKASNDMLGTIYVLDKSNTILLSTDNALINSRFTGEMVDMDNCTLENLSEGYSFYTALNIKDTYYLVVTPVAGKLQQGILKSIHNTLIIFSVFIAGLLGFVLFVTQRIIVRPLNMMRRYTTDRTEITGHFCLQDFEDLRTAIKENTARLEAQQEYTRTILDSQDDMIIISSGVELLDANRSFFNFIGVGTPEEFNSKYSCLCDLFEDCKNPNYLCNGKELGKKWISLVMENPMFRYRVLITRNNTKNIFSINAGKMTHHNEDRYVIVLSDVTIEESYKENLENWVNDEIRKRTKSEQRYHYLFNSLTEGVCIHSFNEHNMPTEFIEVNDKMCMLFGYTREEFLRMTPIKLHKPETLKELSNFANEIHRAGHLEFETELVTKDGSIIICELHSKLMDFYGQKTVFTSIKDITEKKLLEVQMKENEKLLIQQSKLSTLGEMLGSISHQWKQPLNAIALISDYVKDTINENGGSAEMNTYFDQIDTQVRFMAQTIDDFRNFYKPSKDKIVFSVSEVISDIYNMLKPQYKSSGMIVYIIKDDAADDRVTGLASEFKQVIMNLLSNTKDVLDERKRQAEYKDIISGDVTIKIGRTGEKVFIRYYDSGGGIENDIMLKMFQPYNTSKGCKGDGIGMHISRQIIESMNGSISVNNTEKGVCFEIFLEGYAD